MLSTENYSTGQLLSIALATTRETVEHYTLLADAMRQHGIKDTRNDLGKLWTLDEVAATY